MSDGRSPALAELLPAPLLDDTGVCLTRLLGAPLALLDAGGGLLWGEAPAAGTPRHAVAAGAEMAGWLVTNAPPEVARTVTRLLATFVAACNHLPLAAQDHNLRQLYQAEKLASVAQLAAGIAHEINNPIGFARSNLTTLARYLATVRQLGDRLAEAEEAWRELDLGFVLEDSADLVVDSIAGIDRVARIVADLKGFSNVDRPDEAIVDINEGLRAAVAVIEHRKPPGVVLTLAAGTLPPLLCLPGHLNQVFLHILTNALQAVGDRGEIRVASRLEAATAGSRDSLSPSQYIVVDVRDSGPGIAPADLPRVFDPFFTTRPVGQGTGLGLTVARDIVQVHEGSLTLDSTPGQGTRATIRLPL